MNLGLLLKLLKYFKAPPFTDPEALRKWLNDGLDFLAEVATQTGTTLDDTAVRMLKQVAVSPEAFAPFYNLLKALYAKFSATDGVVMDLPEPDAEIDSLAWAVSQSLPAPDAPQAIPIGLIIQIASALIAIFLRKE